jgi:ABC-type dipeptide/oligopeptide/nickel transport system permease component
MASALHADFRDSTWRQRLALAGVGAWLAYEWGPGNESVTAWLLARLLRRDDSMAMAAATTGIGFGFAFVQQLASGLTAAAGFGMFQRSAHAAWQRLRVRSSLAPKPWSELRWPTRAAVAFGLGSTAVALTETMVTGRGGVRSHRRVVVQAACTVGVIVATIAAVVGVVAAITRRRPAWRDETNTILDVLANPLFWLALVVVSFIAGRLRSRASR